MSPKDQQITKQVNSEAIDSRVNVEKQNALATTVLFKENVIESLETQLLHGRFESATNLLSVLCSRENVSLQLIMRAGIAVLEHNFQNQFDLADVLDELRTSSTLNQREVRLFQAVHYMGNQKYNLAVEAVSSASHVKAERIHQHHFVETSLTIGYRALLMFFKEERNDNLITLVHSILSDLYANDAPFLPFVEVYGEVLYLKEGAESLEAFIEDWSGRREAKDFGVVPHVQCLKLIDRFLPGFKLKFQILEYITEADPSNYHVLAFCKALLNNEVSNCDDSDAGESSDDMETGNEDGSAGSQRRTRNVLRCFEIIMEYLDYPDNLHSYDGWEILSNCLSLIFVIGDKKCAEALNRLWVEDRKTWWPEIHFQSIIQDKQVTYMLHKGTVCFLLESQDHPFVKSVLNSYSNKTYHLQNVIQQLEKRKISMDRLVRNKQRNETLAGTVGGQPRSKKVNSGQQSFEEVNETLEVNGWSFTDPLMGYLSTESDDDFPMVQSFVATNWAHVGISSSDATEEESSEETSTDDEIDVSGLVQAILKRKEMFQLQRTAKRLRKNSENPNGIADEENVEPE